MALNAGEVLVLRAVQELMANPLEPFDTETDDNGDRWVRVPAQVVSELLLERFTVALSVKSTRSALTKLVEKGFLLRTRHIGEFKWLGTYLYRLPPEQAPNATAPFPEGP